MIVRSRLTRYRPASMAELITLAGPLMLTIMSGTVMLFVSRLIIAQYSIAAMNAMTALTSFIAVFQFAPIALTSISEVFVGQFNGAGRYTDIGKPVWQMIRVSLFLALIYVPMGLWGWRSIPDCFIEEGALYFKVMMSFAFLMPLIGALSGFYAGRGQVKILTVTALGANILNGMITYILVLGVKDFIQPMGTLGAAIGFVASQLLIVVILFGVFMRKKYRKSLGTNRFEFNKELFWDCLKIGLPHAGSHTVEFAGWSFLLVKVSLTGSIHATVLSVCQNFFILFSFLNEGLQKAMIAVVSNLIGGKQTYLVKKSWKSTLKVFSFIILFLAFPLLVYPDVLLGLFISNNSQLYADVFPDVVLSFYALWVYFIFDVMTWSLGGILTAAGDTKFMMKVNVLTMIFVAILPIYWVCIYHTNPPYLFWTVSVAYAFTNFSLFYWRYRRNIWQKISIAENL